MRFGNVWPMGEKYNIRYLELARSDLLGIAEYVNSQAWERDAANRLVDSLEKAILPETLLSVYTLPKYCAIKQ